MPKERERDYTERFEDLVLCHVVLAKSPSKSLAKNLQFVQSPLRTVPTSKEVLLRDN